MGDGLAMKNNSPNKMETMPVKKLVINVSVPLMISLLVQSLYNIVDSIFVARISEEALTATSLAYPVQMLMIAVSVGTGVGINSLISRKIGAKDYEAVGNISTTGFLLGAASSLVFVLFGTFLAPWFFSLYTQDAALLEPSIVYLRICTWFSLGIFIAAIVERMLQSTGKTSLSMAAQISGCVVNIILDPIMIFGYFGCPAMGVAGAAIATVIGQWVAAIVAILLNLFCNKQVGIKIRGYKPEKSVIATIYKVGLPSMMVQAMGSLMIMSVNNILVVYSATAVAFFGIYYKLQNFVFMPSSGIAQGLIPIVGYNYGAKRPKKIVEAIRFAALLAGIVMAVGTFLFNVIPARLLGLYHASEAMLEMGVPALRILSLIFISTAIVLVIGYAYTGMGNGMVNMVGTLLRQLLPVPIIYFTAKYAGVDRVWYVFWFSDICALTYALLTIRNTYQKVLKPMGEKSADACDRAD